MDAASTVITFKAIAIANTRNLSKSTTLIPSWASTKPIMLRLYSPNSTPNNSLLSFTRCSTKPDTDTGSSDTDKKPTASGANAFSESQDSSKSDSGEKNSSNFSAPPSSFSSRGLVFDLGPPGSWDCAEIGSPVVKRFLSDEEERWYMWYHGRSDKDPSFEMMGLAVSSNGIHWERGGDRVRSSGDVGLVMNCSKDWWAFDTKSIRPSEVVIMSSTKVRFSSAVYWLYYTGHSSEKVLCSYDFSRFLVDKENGEVFKSLPGLAISQDGRYWAKIEGEHHTGALFDVGSERDWDSLFISSPQVFFHGNGDLRMYYHSFDMEKGEFGIGIARSRDGIRWVKLGKILGGGKNGSFDELGVMNPSVVRNRKDGKYMMAYEGIGGDGVRSIGFAISPDGLKEWRRLGNEAILKPSDKGFWDDEGVGSPCLVQMGMDEQEWRLYYGGVGNGRRTRIGMAVSEGSGDTVRFKRWAGFHL